MFFNRRKKVTITEPLHLSTVSSRFELGRSLFGTRNAQGFEARDKTTGESAVFWSLRFPLAPISQEAALVLGHLRKMQACLPPGALLNYGIDRNGTVFYTTPRHKGATLERAEISEDSLQTVFTQMVEQIARVHEHGLVLGTLCAESFLITARDEVHLIGFLPALPTVERVANLKLTEGELSCLAPELRSGGSTTTASDVFSLGALLYRFVGYRYLPGTLNQLQHSEHIRSYSFAAFQGERAPLAWLKQLLETSLKWDNSERLQNGAEMFRLLQGTKPSVEQRAAIRVRRLEAEATAYLLSPATRYLVLGVIFVLTFAVLYRRAEERGILQEWTGRELPIGQIGSTLSSSPTDSADLRQVAVIAESGLPRARQTASGPSNSTDHSAISWSDKISFGRQAVLSGTDPNTGSPAETRPKQPEDRVSEERVPATRPKKEALVHRTSETGFTTAPSRPPGTRIRRATRRAKQNKHSLRKQERDGTLEMLIRTGRLPDAPWCPFP